MVANYHATNRNKTGFAKLIRFLLNHAIMVAKKKGSLLLWNCRVAKSNSHYGKKRMQSIKGREPVNSKFKLTFIMVILKGLLDPHDYNLLNSVGFLFIKLYNYRRSAHYA